MGVRVSDGGGSGTIVVGGGTAGALIAGLLGQRSASPVRLFEEGADEIHPLSRQLVDQPALLGTGPLRRMPERRPEGGGATLLSGRVMGGGWSVNHGVMMMPSAMDLAAVAEAGGPGWAVEHLLALAGRITTDLDRRAQGVEAGTGPVPLARPLTDLKKVSPATRALLEVCAEEGIPWTADVNRDVAEQNASSYAYSSDSGVRVSSATAYLEPARSNDALRIDAGRHVRRLLVEGARVVGMEVVDARTREVRLVTTDGARVVLCAGAFHTPQILLRSGIGPAEQIEACGIRPVIEQHEVGSGLRDHAKFEPRLVLTPHQEDASVAEDPWADDPFGDENKLHLRIRSSFAGTEPDLDLQLRHDVTGREATLTVRILEQRTPGTVRLDGQDIDGLPLIDSGMLRHPVDLRVLTEGVMRGIELLQHPRLAGRYRLQEGAPTSEAQWSEAVRRGYGSYNHAVGTCRMGRDERSVVDEELRFRGLENLFIADASVLPSLPHVTTNYLVAIIGQWAAERFLAAE